MASMRWVTMNPPTMLTEASTSAMKPKALRPARPGAHRFRRGDADREQRADDDHAGDGVGHRHQRRMQRRRHRPHHVVADEDGEDEDREPEDEGVDRPAGRRRDAVADRLRRLVGEALGRHRGVLRRRRRIPGLVGRGARRLDQLFGGHRLHHDPPFGANAGCTTAPSRVRLVALTSSSSQLTASVLFALSIIVSTKA